MSRNSLPGIVKIQWVRCSDISARIMFVSLAGAVVTLALDATLVRFFGTPSLKWDGSLVNGVRLEKSTLEFATADILPDGERIAFIVTTASGRQYIIGTREPKYPQVNYSETVGSPDGDAALRTYKVTHIAQKSVLPCIL